MVVRLPPQGQALGLARPVPADAPDRRLRRGRPGGRDLQAAVAARAAFVPAPAVLHGLLGRLRQGDPGDPARSDGQGRRTRATARRVMSSVGTTPCGSGWRGSCARRSPSARATGCTGSACCCSSTTTTGPGGSTTIPNRPLPCSKTLPSEGRVARSRDGRGSVRLRHRDPQVYQQDQRDAQSDPVDDEG